jgi:hypothetical protein
MKKTGNNILPETIGTKTINCKLLDILDTFIGLKPLLIFGILLLFLILLLFPFKSNVFSSTK